MKCSLCGFKFGEKDAESSCTNCSFMKRCTLIRCPNCGFELPKEPHWIKKLKGRRKDVPER